MKDYPVVVPFPVHWGEMDAFGHVNHARYPVWMETARLVLFRRIGLASEGQPKLGPILVNLNVNYRAPVHFPADIVCGVRIGRIGRTSFTMEYAVAHAESPGDLVADGSTVIVLYDYGTAKTIAIPDDLKASLEGLR